MRPTLAAEAVPDPALSRAYAPCLPGGRLGGPLLAFASVSSTQVICHDRALAGAAEGLVVLADHQTAGRGRRGRAWTSRPGMALLLSCLLRPPLPAARWPELTLAAACAVAEALEAIAGVTPRLKWPNDVLIGERKLAGILAEGVLGHEPFAVLGIGINVGQGSEDWPLDLAGRAVGLAELGRPVERASLLSAVLARLLARYEDLLRAGFEPVREACRVRGMVGGRIEGRGVAGIAVDLNPDGTLVVQADDGQTVRIAAGEIAEVGAPRRRRC